MKKTWKGKVLVALLAVCLAGGTIGAFPAKASASGNGTVTVSNELITQFGLQKTVDLTNSNVEVIITDAERNDLMKEAEAAAKEELAELPYAYTPETLEKKTNELFNIKLGEKFVEKLGKQLDATFTFEMQAIDKGEYAKYGIDEETVLAGKVKDGKAIPFSQVSFSGADQLYDEMLNQYMEKEVLSGSLSDPITEVHRLPKMKDGREIIAHTLLFDLGQLGASDGSQYSWGANREYGDQWEGWHSLLGYMDPLSLYSPFSPREDQSIWSYVQTFNLALNPAVTYLSLSVKADVITGATFDDSGKLLTISKPLIPSDGKIAETKHIGKDDRGFDQYEITTTGYFDEIDKNVSQYADITAPGTYRYKLVESQIAPETLNGAAFVDNTEVKLVDVTVEEVNGNFIYSYNFIDSENPSNETREEALQRLNEEREAILKEYDDLLEKFKEEGRWPVVEGSAEDAELQVVNEKFYEIKSKIGVLMSGINFINSHFVNSFVPPEEPEEPTTPPENPPTETVDINKTIEGSDKYVLKALDETFEYEITTTMPSKGDSFEIIDGLEKVLEFADGSKTVVTIDGKAMSAAEQAKVLTQKNKRLTVKFDKDQVQANAGKKVCVTFQCRLMEGADLTPYANYEVPNIVQYNVSNKLMENYSVALLNVPDELITPNTPSEEETEQPPTTTVNPPYDDTPDDSDKNGNGSKTGDSTNMIIPLLLALMAATTGGFVALRRRKTL